MSDYRRNPNRPAPNRPSGRSGGGRPPQNRRPAPRGNVKKSGWQNLEEIRIPMWAGVGIILVTLVVVVLVSVSLLRGPKEDLQVNAGAQNQTSAVTDALPEEETAAEETVTEESQQTEEVQTGDEVQSGEDVQTGEEAQQTETVAEEEVDVSGLSETMATNAPVVSGGNRTATIRMAGDVIIDKEMLDACYDKSSKTYDFEPYFELIGDTLSSSDYTMINIEASLRKGKYGYSGYPQFTTPPVILDVVKKFGADMITMCNNHMLDGFCDGLVESVGHVEKAGLDHIGGYVDKEDSETPEIYEINGIKVGFVTYTHTTNSMERHCDDRTKFLINYFKSSNCYEDISKARKAGAEVIVAVTHWGEEYKRSPESTTRGYAKALVAAGADIIIGGHPHMAQPAEYITAQGANGETRTALCLYSLGNFLSQHRVQYTDSGVVFEFTIQENADGTFSIINPGYVPVYVWTFKNSKGDADYRVLPVGAYLDNPPSGMSNDQIKRMKQSLQETMELMGGNTVMTALRQ